MIEYRFPAMGSQILVALDSRQEDLKPQVAAVSEWFETWEAALSRFRPDSELSYVNRQAGGPVQVSEIFCQVLEASLAAYRLSNRLITPAILPALESAGYTQSFEHMPYNVAQTGDPHHPVEGLLRIKREPHTRTLHLPPGMKLDFGGVAKGWAAHQAMLRLQHLAPAMVDAGGDIAISGVRQGGQPWQIAVADPLNDLRDLEQLAVNQGGVATSGRDRRQWRQNGAPRHHLIDPRSGLPAETDILSATVIAADVLAAEAAAKTVLIMGSRRGLDWLEKQPGMHGLVTLADGTVVYTKEFQPAVRSLA